MHSLRLSAKIFVAVAAVISTLVSCEERGERRASSGASASAAPAAPSSPSSSTTTKPAAPPSPSETAPPPTTSVPIVASVSANAGHPPTAEVEIFGRIIVPLAAPKNGKLVVYVAQDECLRDDAKILGHIPAATSTGSFAIEVFPKWGTDITICGALEDPNGSATYYGKAVSKEAGGRFHAENVGEVTFNGVEVTLQKGAAHKFPKDSK